MRVQELAELTGASARSVRHYDRAGLLASRRLANGYREFDGAAIQQVRTIRRLIASGLTIGDIVTLQPCLTARGEFDGCDDARRILDSHIDRLERSLERDRRTLRLLDERRRNMAPRHVLQS
ncbi:MAG: MerR family transcriptional regulator [Streptosporangiales bacterium]|nr:MerR family transcriptional regulator [Streptosporangiales bacterium]